MLSEEERKKLARAAAKAVRHARKVHVPCVIVWPDGTCTVEENDAGLRPLL